MGAYRPTMFTGHHTLWLEILWYHGFYIIWLDSNTQLDFVHFFGWIYSITMYSPFNLNLLAGDPQTLKKNICVVHGY
jgi:hypothetical protein